MAKQPADIERATLDRIRAGAGTNEEIRKLVDGYRWMDATNRTLVERNNMLRFDLEEALKEEIA